MNFIHEPTDLFDFQKVHLKTPSLINGGAGGFFSKFSVGSGAATAASESEAPIPLYIKTPACTMKEGFVTSGKKIHCDLMFSREDNEDFIRWMENLVTHTHKLLYSKHDEWFQGGISENDIEDAMISPIKSYKAGKFYLVRCAVKIEDGQPQIRIYDDAQEEISMESVRDKKMVTLLEIKGVKCSLKSFQFEIEIKQTMVIKQFNILDVNLLGGGGTSTKPLENAAAAASIPIDTKNHEDDSLAVADADAAVAEDAANGPENDFVEEDGGEENDAAESEAAESESENASIQSENEEKPPISIDETNIDPSEILDGAIDQYLDENGEFLSPPRSPENDATAFLNDAAIDLEEMAIDEEPVKIKDANELYYKMYQEAKKKARDARKVAINAYLEAKNIKTLYDLDDAEESDFEDDDLDDLSDIENL